MRKIAVFFYLILLQSSYALSLDIPMYTVAKVGNGVSLGKITAVDTPRGVLFKPQLAGMQPIPAVRGFHVHVGDSCDNFGLAAQGHFDPQNTNQHLGPYNAQGHLGDPQVLVINKNGSVTLPVFAPRLSLRDIAGHTLIIHANGDNYSDKPSLLGGGGDRVACGVIPTNSELVDVKQPPEVPVAAKTENSSSETADSATDAQIEELLKRKEKLQAMQEKNRQQLQMLQGNQAKS